MLRRKPNNVQNVYAKTYKIWLKIKTGLSK